MVEFNKKCIMCKNNFQAKSISNKYCPFCKEKRRRINILNLQNSTQYHLVSEDESVIHYLGINNFYEK